MPDLVGAASLSYMAGDDLLLQFTVIDSDGDAIDITGMMVRFAISRTISGTAVISTEASPATATASLTTPASGIFTVAIDGSDTDALSGTYRFECEIEDSSGDKSTVARGFVTFAANLI